MQRERRKHGKKTVFFKNGKPVAIDRLLKRKGLSELTLETAGQAGSLPSNVVARTPSPSLSFITAPAELKIQEELLQTYKLLLEQWQKWPSPDTESGFDLFAKIEKPTPYHDISHALFCANLAFDTSQNDLGGSILRQAFVLVELLVKVESPSWLLLSAWWYLHQARRPEIVKTLIHHFYNLSRTLRPNNLVHKFFQFLVEASRLQSPNQFIKTLATGLIRVLESAPQKTLLVRTVIKLLEDEEDGDQALQKMSWADERLKGLQNQIDKKSPSCFIADLDISHFRLELIRRSQDGNLILSRALDFIRQIKSWQPAILSALNESQASKLHFFAASAFITMSHGYKLLAKNQPGNSTGWNRESIRLLDKAIDVLNTNAGPRGVETLEHTLRFKLFASLKELGSPDDLVKTHQLLNAPKYGPKCLDILPEKDNRNHRKGQSYRGMSWWIFNTLAYQG